MKQELSNGASVRLPIVMTGTSTITATITDGSTVVATLTAEAFNGKSELRLDAVFASMVKDTIRHKYEESPFYEYGAHNIDARVKNIPYRLMRFIKRPVMICTGMPTLTKYQGYELTLPIYNRANDIDICFDHTEWITAQDFDHFETEEGVVSVIVEDNTEVGKAVATNGDGEDEVIRIQKKETPAHPFYLRWLNEYGGWDYWMFTCQQKVTRKLTANEYYEPYDKEGEKIAYHKEADTIVEASTGIVDKKTLECLAYLPLSPDIRLYNKDTQEWMSIQVENGDTEIMTNQPTGELVLSFVVPMLNN